MRSIRERTVTKPDVERLAQFISDEGTVTYRRRKSNDWWAFVAARQDAFADVEALANLFHAPVQGHRDSDGVPFFSVPVEGQHAVDVLKMLRPFIRNEIVATKADCILAHGAKVVSEKHPFFLCGAFKIGRAFIFPKVRAALEARLGEIRKRITSDREMREAIRKSVIDMAKKGASWKEIVNAHPGLSLRAVHGILYRASVSVREARKQLTKH